ncbi:MAG TPA: hypothetical protein PK677_11250 [Acidiphilium sp.]|nr:hypothetical protein [Acidiphilium sp.]
MTAHTERETDREYEALADIKTAIAQFRLAINAAAAKARYEAVQDYAACVLEAVGDVSPPGHGEIEAEIEREEPWIGADERYSQRRDAQMLGAEL